MNYSVGSRHASFFFTFFFSLYSIQLKTESYFKFRFVWNKLMHNIWPFRNGAEKALVPVALESYEFITFNEAINLLERTTADIFSQWEQMTDEGQNLE